MSFYTSVIEGLDNDHLSLSNLDRGYSVKDIKESVAFYQSMFGIDSLEGKKVAILVESVKENISLFYAIRNLKGTVIPLSTQSKRDDLVGVLDSLYPHIVFTDNMIKGFNCSEVISEWAEGNKTKTLVISTDDYKSFHTTSLGGEEESSLYNRGDFITFSSGSTGTPKGIVFKDSVFEHTFKCLHSSWELKPSDNIFFFAPTSSLFGVTGINTIIKSGANFIHSDDFDLLKIVKILDKWKCNKISTTPSIFKAIYNFASNLKPEVLERLELVCVVGEKVSPNYISNFPIMKNCKFLSHLGSSEAGSIADGYITDKDAKDIDFKIVNEAEHRVVDGELLLKTGGLFTEYYNSKSLTDEAFENGWFKTGDLVEFGDDGTFKIVGRKKDVIKKGGRHVVASEIESVIQKIEGVNNVTVIGASHDIYGEQIVAFVAAKNLTSKNIRSYCASRVSSYKIPDKVIFLEEIPLKNNKVDKQKLKALIAEAK
ncbi:class I adenylate-forming enzyme family protein [Bacillus sp. JJ1533]|uniref:class I adenylate-forming enzyme family protein n=1 Tax=Bacillus sp. JJ1533 TaxID=3122959 RepID=UPI002FFF4E33